MNAQIIWDKIHDKARLSEFEIQTVPQVRREPLWFQVSTQGNYLIISKARNNRPSVNLSFDRKINYKDFEFVCGYYERWLRGETGVRHEVSRKSRNTAYIFALIAEAAKIKSIG
jgi:hypothetical protein